MKTAVVVVVIAAAVIVAVCRCNIPDGRIAVAADASRLGVLALRAGEALNLVKVENQRDFLLFKVGSLGESRVVLLPFTRGWTVVD